ncbi:G2/mitotic-specific cyclin S13-7-like [Tripterygium wilfordii]|uniref:G2/mitotic-specific cyclin S13-7-like n=1 Tax=Tripterygium wilfordii TaxID=458696 RepID=UPI0018F84FF1|nr:G2/mitotic-specific cyclin S13-7-like [Tripterygium wilfordii]
MATRQVVPQQARGEGVVGVGRQKKNAAAGDGRNRRALGDIGNLVTVRGNDIKPQAQITRPITRSFCAQLLANAQAAAAAENNKKQVCVNIDKPAPAALVDGVVAVKKAAAGKAVPKKVAAVKTKPKEIIDISSDTEEAKANDKREKQQLQKKKEGGEEDKPKKKAAPTLSSVLTARSKAACGLANKPKEQIVDIDAKDANNHLAAVEYVEDIYKFYKLVENESRPHNYMDSQPDINEKMRSILVDWLMDVHHKFELQPETLYLAINIIDRFLSVKIVPRRELQLVGISAMLIASKYEEIWAPEVNDLVCIADRAYSHQQILVMEKTILGKLEWNLTVPTHYVFLARFIKAAIPDQEVSLQMENMVYFLGELGIMHYDTIIMFCPSMLAASAVYVARCALNKTPSWTETLKLHTGFSESQLMGCAKLLALFHSKAAESKLQVVYRKYSNPQRGAVAILPPAKSLLLGSAGSQL